MNTALNAAPMVSAVTASVRDRPSVVVMYDSRNTREQRIHHVRAHAHAARDEQPSPVMPSPLRRAALARAPVSCGELRRFGDADAQPQAERHQHHAGQQRQAPSPVEHCSCGISAEVSAIAPVATSDADRRPHLRERSIAAALLVACRARPTATPRRPIHRRAPCPARIAASPTGWARARRPAHRWAAGRSASCVMPIMSSVITSTKRRPCRSPRCPNRMPPKGRDR